MAANLARKVGVDPETALIETNRKFERRFHYIENALAEQNIPIEDADLEKMDSLWDAAKKEGKIEPRSNRPDKIDQFRQITAEGAPATPLYRPADRQAAGARRT